jgi:hypothetical protein
LMWWMKEEIFWVGMVKWTRPLTTGAVWDDWDDEWMMWWTHTHTTVQKADRGPRVLDPWSNSPNAKVRPTGLSPPLITFTCAWVGIQPYTRSQQPYMAITLTTPVIRVVNHTTILPCRQWEASRVRVFSYKVLSIYSFSNIL